MKRRLATILVLSAAVAAAGAIVLLRRAATPEILDTHTRFLFGQLEDSYRHHLRDGSAPAASEAAFLELVRRWEVDWNSCEFRGGQVVDAWGTAVDVRVDASAVRLRSAGPDRRFDTADDIAAEVSSGAGAPPPHAGSS